MEHLTDCPALELGRFLTPSVGDALICQPGIQPDQTRDHEPGAEKLVAQSADLVLDLPLLPSRGGRVGHRINQMR